MKEGGDDESHFHDAMSQLMGNSPKDAKTVSFSPNVKSFSSTTPGLPGGIPFSSSYESEHQGGGGEAEFVSSSFALKHMTTKPNMLPHIIVPWADAMTRDRCTVYIWAPSGVSPADVSAKIMPGGSSLQVTYPWPRYMQDAMELNQKHLAPTSAKITEIEKILKKVRMNSNQAIVSSTVEIELGIQVEEQFFSEDVFSYKYLTKVQEKGIKFIRFKEDFKGQANDSVVWKFEMMGVRDNYKAAAVGDDSFDDGDLPFATVPQATPRKRTRAENHHHQNPNVIPSVIRTAGCYPQEIHNNDDDIENDVMLDLDPEE